MPDIVALSNHPDRVLTLVAFRRRASLVHLKAPIFFEKRQEMWQRTPRASSIGSVIMQPRDKRNGEQWRTCSSGTQSAPWRENEALLYVAWIRAGCKTMKRWVIPYSLSRTKTWAASPIKADRYRFWPVLVHNYINEKYCQGSTLLFLSEKIIRLVIMASFMRFSEKTHVRGKLDTL